MSDCVVSSFSKLFGDLVQACDKAQGKNVYAYIFEQWLI